MAGIAGGRGMAPAEGTILNQYAKLTAAGALFGSLFFLVLTGKIQASDYQTLAVGALGALGGYHARGNL